MFSLLADLKAKTCKEEEWKKKKDFFPEGNSLKKIWPFLWLIFFHTNLMNYIVRMCDCVSNSTLVK